MWFSISFSIVLLSPIRLDYLPCASRRSDSVLRSSISCQPNRIWFHIHSVFLSTVSFINVSSTLPSDHTWCRVTPHSSSAQINSALALLAHNYYQLRCFSLESAAQFHFVIMWFLAFYLLSSFSIVLEDFLLQSIFEKEARRDDARKEDLRKSRLRSYLVATKGPSFYSCYIVNDLADCSQSF